jgi:hypothetical protein
MRCCDQHTTAHRTSTTITAAAAVVVNGRGLRILNLPPVVYCTCLYDPICTPSVITGYDNENTLCASVLAGWLAVWAVALEINGQPQE